MPGPISTIARLARGWFYGHNDEVTIVPDKGFTDCSKYRAGSWNAAGWLAAFSGNVFSGDESNPSQYEKAKIGIVHDDDYPKEVEAYAIDCWLQDPGGRDDHTDRLRLRLTTNYLEVFGQRVFFNHDHEDQFAAGVAHLYRTLLFRDPEPGVIDRWRASSSANLDTVRQGILGSPEYATKH